MGTAVVLCVPWDVRAAGGKFLQGNRFCRNRREKSLPPVVSRPDGCSLFFCRRRVADSSIVSGKHSTMQITLAEKSGCILKIAVMDGNWPASW